MKFFRLKYPVSGNDIDTQYRLTPNAIMGYSQDCAARYMAQHRMAAYDIIADNLIWVISEVNMELSDELPFWSDEVEVEVWVSEISALRFFVEFRMYDDRRRVFAGGHYVFSLLHKDTRRLTPFGSRTDCIERHEEYAAGKHKHEAFPAFVGEPAAVATQRISYAELDFNSHVSNRCYPAIAERLIPAAYRVAHTVRQLDIRYRNEAFLDDRIICEMFCPEPADRYSFRFLREGDNALLCLIDSTWQPFSPRTIYDK